MLSMILGEIANFAAYAFAPAIIVTPLGALSIIISAVLSHYVLNEKLNSFGWLGCALCIVGSANIVLHAPVEKEIESIKEVVNLMLQPTFLSCSGVCSNVYVRAHHADLSDSRDHAIVSTDWNLLFDRKFVGDERENAWISAEDDV